MIALNKRKLHEVEIFTFFYLIRSIYSDIKVFFLLRNVFWIWRIGLLSIAIYRTLPFFVLTTFLPNIVAPLPKLLTNSYD